MAVEVTLKGPLFDGRAQAALDEFMVAAVQSVADVAKVELVDRMRDTFRDPTPYYWTKVRSDRASSGPDVTVNDDRVIYGPWLEGVGSRNFPVTSFRGYHIWRKEENSLRQRATRIAEAVLPRYLAEMR